MATSLVQNSCSLDGALLIKRTVGLRYVSVLVIPDWSPRPGFVTGTSSEFVGSRPLRRWMVERPVVLILGPRGSGRSCVAARIAKDRVDTTLHLCGAEVEQLLAQAMRAGGTWPSDVLAATSLIIDGIAYLKSRRSVADLLLALIAQRASGGLRTVVCMLDDDPTCQVLMDAVEPGQLVTVMLRLPKSRSGRLRFARRICDQLGLERIEARGTDLIEPWSYEVVLNTLRQKAARPSSS